MENKKKAIMQENVDFTYSRGLYRFFCNSTAKLFAVVLAILASVKSFDQRLKTAEYSRLVSCLWIVNHNARKLEGICSVSSSVHDNCFCAAWRKIKGCICEHCYANNQQAYQTGLKEHNIINGLILRNILIPVRFSARL